MHDVVADSSLIQYRLQLFRSGFHDDFVGRDAESTADRMKQLETHRSRWSHLERAEKIDIDVPGTPGLSNLVGGVFSVVTGEQRTSLHFIRLPSSSRGIAQEEWIIDDLQMPIDYYTTDPSSDLLIVYEDQSSEHSR